jgi:chemotaxis signal transduction protein
MQQYHLYDTPDTHHIVYELQLTCLQPGARRTASEPLLMFRLGDAYYTIPARLVQGICPLLTYTPLPFTEPGIVGVVNINDRLLVVLDVRSLFQQPCTAPQRDARLLLVKLDGLDTGLLADSVPGHPAAPSL